MEYPIIKLFPCYFKDCRNPNAFVDTKMINDHQLFFVRCKSCNASGPTCSSEIEACNAWNNISLVDRYHVEKKEKSKMNFGLILKLKLWFTLLYFVVCIVCGILSYCMFDSKELFSFTNLITMIPLVSSMIFMCKTSHSLYKIEQFLEDYLRKNNV